MSRDLAYFSDDRVAGPNHLQQRPSADVLNLHWVANYLDYRRFFATVPRGHPLVWTLHDMAPMTGGCHYAMSCDRFTAHCGACPLLGSDRQRDLTRRIHDRKSRALSGLEPQTTCIVAPSHWLAEEARRSSLLGRFRVEVIPNGLDIETFAPRDRATAREVLGLPREGRVVLFSADAVSDRRKGGDLLHAALSGLDPELAVTLVSMGSGSSGAVAGGVSLGRIETPRLMSYVYSAADLFVLPTRADNLPNVLVEALACGVPCVSFDVGGVRDVVRHEDTGLLAPPEDADALRAAIGRLLRDDVLRARMAARCRDIAERDYADIKVAERYKALYEELVEASRRVKVA